MSRDPSENLAAPTGTEEPVATEAVADAPPPSTTITGAAVIPLAPVRVPSPSDDFHGLS